MEDDDNALVEVFTARVRRDNIMDGKAGGDEAIKAQDKCYESSSYVACRAGRLTLWSIF
jgi:hypothetical protein